MNEQLTEVAELLNQYSVRHWVDDGTLLGLVRDSELPESDGDIDIGVCIEDKEELNAIVPGMENNGYKLVKKTFHGLTTSYAFKPVFYKRFKTHERPINIKFYRNDNGHRWYPTYRRMNGDSFRLKDWHLARLYRKFFKRIRHEMRLPTWPKQIYDVRTYWVPEKYFEDLSPLQEYNTYTPMPVNQYLKFKFGPDWRIPTDDWDYWEDDGAIRSEPPETLIEEPPWLK